MECCVKIGFFFLSSVLISPELKLISCRRVEAPVNK